MRYDRWLFGPALKALRKARGLKQADVARKLGRSEPTVSRLEQGGVNPQLSSLVSYLEAVDADLKDFHDQMAELAGEPIAEALDEQVERGEKRLEHEPAYRRLASDLLERFGGPDLPPGLRYLTDLIDEHEARLRKLEGGAPGGEKNGPDGTDGG